MNLSESEKFIVQLNKTERYNLMMCELLKEQILKGKLTLGEINQELRLEYTEFYRLSLRISRNSCKSLINDLELVLSDINNIDNHQTREKLIDIVILNISLSETNYSGVKDFENFKKTIPKEIMQRMLLS